MTGLKNDLLKDMNRQVYGTGNGAVATLSAAAAASATVTVSDARALQIGEVVDIVTLPSTVASQGLVVAAVNLATGVVTLQQADGSAASVTAGIGAIITRTGSGPSASGNREITGLGAIVSDTGAIYNIDPSTEPLWKSYVDSNGGTGRAVTEALFINAVDNVRVNGGKTSLILTSLGVRRAYWALLSSLRSVVNTQEFKGGFTGLAFTTDMGEVPIVSDPDAPKGQALFLDESHLTVYRDEDWHWLDRDQMWHQVVDSQGVHDAWFATMARYHEIGTDRRNAHAKIVDLTEA